MPRTAHQGLWGSVGLAVWPGPTSFGLADLQKTARYVTTDTPTGGSTLTYWMQYQEQLQKYALGFKVAGLRRGHLRAKTFKLTGFPSAQGRLRRRTEANLSDTCDQRRELRYGMIIVKAVARQSCTACIHDAVGR